MSSIIELTAGLPEWHSGTLIGVKNIWLSVEYAESAVKSDNK